MTPTATRLAAGIALLALAGCTTNPSTARPLPPDAKPIGAMRLVSFDDCADLLAGLRAAARESVGPYGFSGHSRLFGVPEAAQAAGDTAARADGKAAAAPGDGSYSTTNSHEAGADEPDLVKTDGRRIVTATGGMLRVVDAATRRITGTLDLRTATNGEAGQWTPSTLLLAGDRALVLLPQGFRADIGGDVGDSAAVPSAGRAQLLLVDLAGKPRVISRYSIDGSLLDARQAGATARVVIRSSPQIRFPEPKPDGKEADLILANQRTIDRATADAWLPGYRVETDGRVTDGRVDCSAVSRPATYSGTSMLTVLTFDLGGRDLANANPVSLVADGDTVYSNGSSLYVATDNRWRTSMPWLRRGEPASRPPATTELYRFDISGSGKPRFVAAGDVTGWLINQYALSEWEGHLRVATTTGESNAPAQDFGTAGPSGARPPSPPRSESTVYVLRQDADRLVERGRVGGLGRGEQIYGVRFAGTTGYVVTFRQTDPLYTIDLRDPAAPKVAGELKITGYSAYLHPAGDGRLIGIGQEATTAGRRTGTQVSLFDVSDLAKPNPVARHEVRQGNSEAEFDPHAFLYWPATGLLVVPMQNPNDRGTNVAQGALALSIGNNTIKSVGTITHPEGAIRRSLMINNSLWTVSEAGLKVSDATSAADLGWLPFD